MPAAPKATQRLWVYQSDCFGRASLARIIENNLVRDSYKSLPFQQGQFFKLLKIVQLKTMIQLNGN